MKIKITNDNHDKPSNQEFYSATMYESDSSVRFF